MSRTDELPPDQRAALSVLLRGKSYAEVAGMLGIAEQTIHDRAHAALGVLAPREAKELDAATREQVGDYLLGQQGAVAERLRLRTLLETSPAASAWARAVAEQLAADAPMGLPEIPAPASVGVGGTAPAATARTALPISEPTTAPVASPPPAPGGQRSSRLGGALLLLAIVAAVVVTVVLLTNGGGGKKPATVAETGTSAAGTGASAAATGTSTTGTSTTRTGTTGSSAPTKPEASFTLKAPGTGSRSTGTVAVFSEGEKRAFYIQAEHIPATSGFFYAIWLYNSPTSALPLSKAPSVGASHKLSGAALLPSNASEYHEILLTRETSSRPSKPGHIVLRGPFNLKA